MLTQPAECDKLDAAIRFRAPVDLVLVARALQVQVEPRERRERAIAHEALVRRPIPRALRRPHARRRGRLGPPKRPSEQPCRVRDVVVRIDANNEAVELFAGHARRAGA